jgi:hypothetical protein
MLNVAADRLFRGKLSFPWKPLWSVAIPRHGRGFNSTRVPVPWPWAGEVGGLAGSGEGAHQQAIRRRGAGNYPQRQVLPPLQLFEQSHR